MTVVYARHLRSARVCVRGARRWAERHGIDWRRFVRYGIEADELRAIGDGHAELAIAAAEREEAEHDA